ncbi:uncharacterized protein F4812DRAFT_471332 [Daldinia caldariorum]|uniref:uncharacterized protein n=1 Tax=Daldinia caldariorum TaxID=326644 RepID=UPI002007A665|nr:uncharacterized protein F4812DRAFT_471332 [Daldinia caldariorum]KAI1468062.1 hypothetical protein F4812DRAFT_471332 [Daldinia caldariorum]
MEPEEDTHVQAKAFTPSQGVLNLACYKFRADTWFTLSDSMPVDAWPRAWHTAVESVWLFALPTPDRFHPLPNPWKLALKLRGGKLIVFGIIDCALQAPKPTSSHMVIFHPYTDEESPPSDADRLVRNSVYTIECSMRTTMPLMHFVNFINRRGDIINYTLLSSAQSLIGPRGRRFWIHRVLERMEPILQRDRNIHAFPDDAGPFHEKADRLMRRCWLPGKIHTGHFGSDDEEDNPLRIVPGADILGGAFILPN